MYPSDCIGTSASFVHPPTSIKSCRNGLLNGDPKQRRIRGSHFGCKCDYIRGGTARVGLSPLRPRPTGMNLAADRLRIRAPSPQDLTSRAQNRRKCASSLGNRRPNGFFLDIPQWAKFISKAQMGVYPQKGGAAEAAGARPRQAARLTPCPTFVGRMCFRSGFQKADQILDSRKPEARIEPWASGSSERF
jgi:hypothetical protein